MKRFGGNVKLYKNVHLLMAVADPSGEGTRGFQSAMDLEFCVIPPPPLTKLENLFLKKVRGHLKNKKDENRKSITWKSMFSSDAKKTPKTLRDSTV